MGTYVIDDPRLIAREAPYTFYLPSAASLEAIRPGFLAKLLFQPVPGGRDYGAERMWVIVTHRDGEDLTGTLDNQPFDIPGLNSGDRIEFKLWQTIDFLSGSEEQDAILKGDQPEQDPIWLHRCFVDAAVLEGRARVQYVYREPPEHDDNDDYPDSGWRFRGDPTQMKPEENEEPDGRYVAIGAVLNRDDSFLSLLGAPEGARYMRRESSDVFDQLD